MSRLTQEVALPFHAFAAAGSAPVETLSAEVDGGFAGLLGAAAPVDPQPAPERARPGRVVLAVSRAYSAACAAEVVGNLLARLGEISDPPHTGLGHDNDHDPADLDFWGALDARRALLAIQLDLVVCTHVEGLAVGQFIVTVDAPAELGFALLLAAQAVAAPREVLLLTDVPNAAAAAPADLLAAATRHANRMGGQAEVFPGQDTLQADLPVAEVIACTSIDQVTSAHGPYASDAVLRAYGFVRPHYDQGLLVLPVGHDDAKIVTPWNVRYSRPCCAAH